MNAFDAGHYIDKMARASCEVVAYRYASGERHLSIGVPHGAEARQHRRWQSATAAYNADPEAGTKVFDECVRRGLVVDLPANWLAKTCTRPAPRTRNRRTSRV
jgi:hypothetical protein